MSSFFRNQSVGIKAAYITGACVIIAALITASTVILGKSCTPDTSTNTLNDIVIRIDIKNNGPNRVEINPLIDFYLDENEGGMIQEISKGRANLVSINNNSNDLYSSYSLDGNETKHFKVIIHNSNSFESLLERGGADISFVVYFGAEFGVETTAFQKENLENNTILVNINYPP